MNQDTIKLVNECCAGCQMAVDSIDQVAEHSTDSTLTQILSQFKQKHESLKKRCSDILHNCGETIKKPAAYASAFSWMSTGVKMSLKPTSTQIAKIMMDGCNMGIQSTGENLSKYPSADKEAIEIAKELIKSEEELSKKMEEFL